VLVSLVVLSLWVCGAFCASSWWTVYYSPTTGQYSVQARQDRLGGVGVAQYADERYTNGWTRFNIETNSVYADAQQAFGAGYLEGYVTSDIIWQSWSNSLANLFKGNVSAPIVNFFNQNIAWMNSQILRYGQTEPYWRQVALVVTQLNGTLAGYNAAQTDGSKKLTLLAFWLMNSAGDLETIQNKFNTNARSQSYIEALRGTHCSSLIKVSPDLSELYAGHTTWSQYFTMLRVYKSYTFPFAASNTNARTTLFSSYPACLSSIDDFYQLSTKLVVMETTNGLLNNKLYVYVTPTNVLSWVRIIVANRMARDGKEWVQIFSNYNSGTYNNQWIIVDYELFTPYLPLRDGLLTIAEQIPNLVKSADVTSYLRNGYWPSFNIPFFKEIFDASGFNDAIKTYGDWLTYDLSPRAQIFRRDANNVKNMDDYLAVLRYNNWKNDPLSDGNPGNQISSRFDLVPPGPPPPNPYLARAPFGGIDSKGTNSALVNAGVSLAQSGPTHDSVPAFSWSANNWSVQHVGLPDTFNFGWVYMPSGTPK